MRGNEVRGSFRSCRTADRRFPIPMRGNEIASKSSGSPPCAFPIPMRGNGVLVPSGSLRKMPGAVSDPHEG